MNPFQKIILHRTAGILALGLVILSHFYTAKKKIFIEKIFTENRDFFNEDAPEYEYSLQSCLFLSCNLLQ